MRYLVVYDITNDRIRAKVAERLKDYGLKRIQYSAFLGELLPRRLKSLIKDLRKILGPEARGKERKVIHVFPLPSSLSGVVVIGYEWEEEERVEVL